MSRLPYSVSSRQQEADDRSDRRPDRRRALAHGALALLLITLLLGAVGWGLASLD